MAEETGMIVALGGWIMDKVGATAAIWARRGISQRLAINVGMRELSQPDFFFRLREAMQRHGVSGTQLELEITETMAMELDAKVLMQIRTLRLGGVRIAIYDFAIGRGSCRERVGKNVYTTVVA